MGRAEYMRCALPVFFVGFGRGTLANQMAEPLSSTGLRSRVVSILHAVLSWKIGRFNGAADSPPLAVGNLAWTVALYRMPVLKPARNLPSPVTKVTTLPNKLRVATEESYGQASAAAAFARLRACLVAMNSPVRAPRVNSQKAARVAGPGVDGRCVRRRGQHVRNWVHNRREPLPGDVSLQVNDQAVRGADSKVGLLPLCFMAPAAGATFCPPPPPQR